MSVAFVYGMKKVWGEICQHYNITTNRGEDVIKLNKEDRHFKPHSINFEGVI